MINIARPLCLNFDKFPLRGGGASGRYQSEDAWMFQLSRSTGELSEYEMMFHIGKLAFSLRSVAAHFPDRPKVWSVGQRLAYNVAFLPNALAIIAQKKKIACSLPLCLLFSDRWSCLE